MRDDSMQQMTRDFELRAFPLPQDMYPPGQGPCTSLTLVHGGLRSDGVGLEDLRKSPCPKSPPNVHCVPAVAHCQTQEPQARQGPRISTRGPCAPCPTAALAGTRAAGRRHPRGQSEHKAEPLRSCQINRSRPPPGRPRPPSLFLVK